MPWEFLLLNQVMVEHLKLFLHADETCLDHSFQFLSCQTVQKHSGIAWLNIRITWEVFSLAVEIYEISWTDSIFNSSPRLQFPADTDPGRQGGIRDRVPVSCLGYLDQVCVSQPWHSPALLAWVFRLVNLWMALFTLSCSLSSLYHLDFQINQQKF